MANEKSIKIVSFTTLGAEEGPLCQDVADSFKNFFSTLGDGSGKPKKDSFDDVPIDSYYKTAYIAAFLCHC